MPRVALAVLSPLLLLTGVLLVADHEYGRTAPEVRLETSAPPPSLAAVATAPPSTVPDRSGVPVELVIPAGFMAVALVIAAVLISAKKTDLPADAAMAV